MVQILRRWLTADMYQKIYGKPLGEKIQYLWRYGWTNVPDLMACTALVLMSHGLFAYALHIVDDEKRPKYRRHYIVYRPEDPRVKLINNKCALDFD